MSESAALPSTVALVPVPSPLKLDLGCGTKREEGFIGVDRIAFPNVDVVMDVGMARWPWDDASVDEVHSSHMLEHLKPLERVHFVNELWRVLKPTGKATIAVPDWSSARAYGDLTHEWPPVTPAWLFHLQAEWRKTSAPHEDFYSCDFTFTFGYSVNPAIVGRSQEWMQFATSHYKDVCSDFIFTLMKPTPKK